MHKGTMRSLLVGFVSATVFSGAALAADMSRPVYKAPPAGALPVTYDWTGFYVGGHVGYGWAEKDWRDAFGLNVSSKPNGFLGGGQVGFNYQIGQFVLGAEGDFSWSGINGGTNTVGTVGAPLGNTFNTDVNWVSTLTGRAGLAFDRWLVYGKGGVAWANDQYNLTSPNLALLPAFSGNETRFGWMVGAGVEYAFFDNWSAKVEYNYLDFHTSTLQFADTTQTFILNTSIQQQLHLVKVGLNYRWGWAPVGIRY